MDVQSINAMLKPGIAGAANTGAPGDGNDTTSTAFASLLQLAGSRYGSGATIALAGLETRLMQSDTTVPAPKPQENNTSSDQNTSSSANQPKTAKTDDKDDNSSNGNATSAHTAATSNQDANAHDASQAQVTVEAQAAVVAPVAAPVEQQTTTTTDDTPQVAAVAAAAPVDPNAQTAVVTPQAQIAQAAAAPTQQAAAAAPVVQQAAAPVTAAPQTASVTVKTQAAAATQTATDNSDDTDDSAMHLMGDANLTQAANTAAPAVQPVRSAAAQSQATSLSRMLGSGNQIQVQVQTTNAAPATPSITAVNPYDHYSGYTAPTDDTSIANGQVGVSDPTNALVASTKTSVDMPQAQAAAIVLPPQLQSQVNQTTSNSTARIEATAPIQALESTSSAQNNTQTQSDAGAGFEAFGNAPNGTAAAAKTQSPAPAQSQPPVTAQQVVDQIKVSITRAAKAGIDKVNIQLKPEALGRIDVKLEMTDDQKVKVTVTADNQNTLNLLQSDSHTLQSALNDAGLRTDNANLTFNLRSESDQQQANQNSSGSGQQNGGANQTGDETGEDTGFATYDYGAAARFRGGVDTFA